MNLEVLVSTMNQINHVSFVEKMNIQTKALIVDQCNDYDYKEFSFKGNKIRVICCEERGIGLSRNTALMRSESDLCLFADDDVKFVDGYADMIIEEFKNNPSADIIFFNVPSTNEERPTALIEKYKRVRWYNSLKFGAVNIAVKSESIKKSNVTFSLLFGGGAKYSAGEDSLFILDCLRNNLKAYASPITIGRVSQEDSSWFNGYTDKYFFDKGIWLANAFPNFKYLLAVYYSFKMKNMAGKSFLPMYKSMLRGIKNFDERK